MAWITEAQGRPDGLDTLPGATSLVGGSELGVIRGPIPLPLNPTLRS